MDRDTRRTIKRTPHSARERWTDEREAPDEVASVRLLRKYADMIDGVNLETAEVGDRLELSRRDADMLIAEGWAERAEDERRVRVLPRRAQAADTARSPRKKSRT